MGQEHATLTLLEKVRLTAGNDMWSTCALPQYGLPAVRMADGPMGITGGRVDERDVALLTPCGLSLAASWDRSLVRRVGEVIGDEALRMGVQAVLAPNLNLMRSPLAGRAFELFGEDPYLIAELGSAWAQGVQGRGVASVIKHVVCNDSETNRRGMNAVVDECTLRDVYFWPFEVAARQGAWAMLTGYNRVNGAACAEQGRVLTDWLQGDLAWDGLVMSDWFGTRNGAASLSNGLDLEMPGPARHMGTALLEGAGADTVIEARVDDAVDRLVRLAGRVAKPKKYEATAQAQTHRLTVLEDAAAAGMVLLRNEGALLPLADEKPGILAIIGPNATVPCFQGGTFAKVALSSDVTSPLQALRDRFEGQGKQVMFAQGVAAEHRIPPLTALALLTDQGLPGIDLFFYSGLDEPAVHHEVRHASSLIWFKDMPGVGNLLTLDCEATIKAQTHFAAERSGEYRFYVGGTGGVALNVNGQCLATCDGVSLEADIMGKLMQAPHTTVSVGLEAGQKVELEFEMRIARSLAHGLWFGCQVPQELDLLEQAVALAQKADAVVLMVGETADAGLESIDRATTHLSRDQEELVRRVCAANSNTVVVLNVAHPVDIVCMEEAASVLLTWYPGQQFGPALASVLSGDREPGGRLPVTFARHEEDYPVWSLTPAANGDLEYHEGWWVGYRSFVARDIHPAFGFGYGQGYARFDYAPLGINGKCVNDLEVEISLSNISSRAGKEVVQLYLLEPQKEGLPIRLSLKAFESVHLKAGAQQAVRLQLSADAFSRWDAVLNRQVLVCGRYELLIGHSVDDIAIRLQLDVEKGGGVRTP